MVLAPHVRDHRGRLRGDDGLLLGHPGAPADRLGGGRGALRGGADPGRALAVRRSARRRVRLRAGPCPLLRSLSTHHAVARVAGPVRGFAPGASCPGHARLARALRLHRLAGGAGLPPGGVDGRGSRGERLRAGALRIVGTARHARRAPGRARPRPEREARARRPAGGRPLRRGPVDQAEHRRPRRRRHAGRSCPASHPSARLDRRRARRLGRALRRAHAREPRSLPDPPPDVDRAAPEPRPVEGAAPGPAPVLRSPRRLGRPVRLAGAWGRGAARAPARRDSAGARGARRGRRMGAALGRQDRKLGVLLDGDLHRVGGRAGARSASQAGSPGEPRLRRRRPRPGPLDRRGERPEHVRGDARGRA